MGVLAGLFAIAEIRSQRESVEQTFVTILAMPQVSVIIPAYRVTGYIAEALDSVFGQSFQNFDVFVVNDCCPDTEALERVLGPYRSRINYLKLEKNSGPSAARNAAIIAAKAPYLALLDADDLWEPSYLETQLKRLQKDPTIDVLYCDGRLFGSPADEGRLLMDLNPSRGAVTYESLMNLECTVLVSVMAKREIFLKAGLFEADRRRAEDFDLWLRVVKAGGRIAYHRDVLVRSRRRDDSASANEAAMLEADIEVAAKAKRIFALTERERTVTDRQMRLWQGRLDILRGKEALKAGRMEDAAKHFHDAYTCFKSPKLAVVAGMARVAPGLLAWVNRRIPN